MLYSLLWYITHSCSLRTFRFLFLFTASVGFMAQLVPAERKLLGVYPVVLFYMVISWMILVQG
jgi:hypothetical protein